MIIRVRVSVDPDIALEERTEFDRFAVRVHGFEQDAHALANVFDEIGVQSESGEHVFVMPETVRRLAGEYASDADWNEAFGRMVTFAAARGWVSADGGIRAHIEGLSHG